MADVPGQMALSGIRVLDCTHILSGPYCTMLLADMGAEVIKLERPFVGEDGRESGYKLENAYTSHFVMVNRGKKSAAVDIRSPEGRNVVYGLVKQSDVLVENLRPGRMEAYGLDHASLVKLKPDLITCSISGFGQYGPYAQRGGFDIIAQAMSGVLSINGHRNGPLTKVGVPIGDLNAGMYAAYAILAALLHRTQSGEGQHIDVALLDSILPYLCWESAELWTTGHVPEPVGAAHRDRAPYEPLRAADGMIVVGAGNQHTWELLCGAIGRTDLLEDKRFQVNQSRLANIEALRAELQQTLAGHSVDEWVSRLNDAGCPASPVYTLKEAYEDPQVVAREMVVEVEDPALGLMKHIGVPPKLSRTPGSARGLAPRLGEHTREVLELSGLSEGDIKDLLVRWGVQEGGG